MNLYLIALIPHLKLRAQIKSLKEEMKTRFNAKHALKSPAHITLQMPFKRSVEDETRLINTIQKFSSQQHSFTVNLSGFDRFEPRVLFVKITNPKPIVKLHSELKKTLVDILNFQDNELTQKVHPHLTIATRDLTEDIFYKAWPEFEKREFESSFTVKSLYLLKHNGKTWDIYREFPF